MASMSKQDFEVIASVLYAARRDAADAADADAEHWAREGCGQDTQEAEESGGLLGRVDAIDDLIGRFANALAETNGMFQRDKFVRAATTGQHIRRSILPRA